MARKKEPVPLAAMKIEQDVKKIMERYKELFDHKVEEPARMCSCCKKVKAPHENYFASRNPLVHNKRIGVCRRCIKKHVNFGELAEAQYFLSLLNAPFIEELWLKSLAKDDIDPLSHYLKMLNFSDYAEYEPASLDNLKSYTASAEKDPYWLALKDLSEYEQGILFAKWGDHYDILDCLKLEEYYNDMMEDYQIKTRAHQDYLKNIAKVSLQMDKMIADGDFSGYEKIAKTYDNLMKSANFAEMKAKEDKRDLGYNAFGELFEMAEKQGFIPKFHTDEPRDIVDKTIKNLKAWTQSLIQGEVDINTLMDNAAKRVLEQEQEEQKQEEYDEYYGVAGLEDDLE